MTSLLIIKTSQFIHAVTCQNFLLLSAWKHSCVCTNCILSICSSADRHMCCFHFLAIGSNARNTGLQIPIWAPAFSSFEYTPWNGTARSFGNSIFDFSRDCHTVSQWLHHSTFPTALPKSSHFSTSSPAPFFPSLCFPSLAPFFLLPSLPSSLSFFSCSLM